jgi:uncharacterized protein (DUF2141 family)
MLVGFLRAATWFAGMSAVSSVAADEAESHTLIVDVQGLRSTTGQLAVALFDRAEAFPDQGGARAGSVIAAKHRHHRFEFRDLRAGRYAVAVLHDENGNGKMDFNLVGIPIEGFGFSNNARVVFGPPSFDAAAFTLRVKRGRISIDAKYLL